MTDENGESIYAHVNQAASNLIASVAVVGAMLEADPRYENAREGFIQRVEEVTEYLDTQVEQIQSWGAAFDDPDDAQFEDL